MLACRPINYRSKKVDFKPEEESSEELDEETANQKTYLDPELYMHLQAMKQERELEKKMEARQ